MDAEDAKKYLKETRPALAELSNEDTKESCIELAINALVELDPNLGKVPRDQVSVVLVALLCAAQRERGEPVAIAR
ncbi:MAG: hypothetical protein WCB59_07910 [Candidatus Sulfotelmatobacter sp.]